MNQKSAKSQKLEKWLKWMQTIHDEIIPLLSDVKVFWEVRDIIRQNPHIQKPSYFYRYLERSYFSHALAGLRRQIKLQKDSISFVGLLKDIAENPTELSLRYYRSRRKESEDMVPDSIARLNIDVTKEEFSQYADPNCQHICPKMVESDLKKLKQTAKICEDFADKRIAHWDKRGPKSVPTFPELDDCLKLLDKTYVKYHLLSHAEWMETLDAEFQYDWKVIFREPWLIEHSGEYVP